jgi:putative endonuclease
MFLVYILKSLNKNWYYVGSTNRLEDRLKEHNSGKVRSTKGFIPLSLVYTKEFGNENEARVYEHKIKSSRIEKESIIKSIK